MSLRSVTIVGPGRMGLTLGMALAQSREVRNLTVFGRHPEPPAHPLFEQGLARYVFGVEPLERDSTVVLLAVPDAHVPEAAHVLAAQGPAPGGCSSFHLSGALPTDVLEPLYHQGYGIGSFHPLVAVSHPMTGADHIPGSYVAVTGAPETVRTARLVADAIGMSMFAVPASRRTLYHAAVVMASSYLIPMLGLSARLMERAGVDPDDATTALIPLVRSTLASVEEHGLPDSLRGPIARGDLETTALHLRALDPGDQHLYALVGSEVLRIGAHGLDPRIVEEMNEMFDRYVGLETTRIGTGE
jgi:predicted short-subunit dehydrogenase-like oxidoreductase (DUF2520 family)